MDGIPCRFIAGRNKLEEQVQVNNDPYKTCLSAHAVAVLTEWDDFKTYDWQKIYNDMLKPAFVFDGRNFFALIRIPWFV